MSRPLAEAMETMASLQREADVLRDQLREELATFTMLSNRVATLVIQELTSPGSLKIHLDQNRRLSADIQTAIDVVQSIQPQKDGSVHDENHVQNNEQISG